MSTDPRPAPPFDLGSSAFYEEEHEEFRGVVREFVAREVAARHHRRDSRTG